MPYPTRKDVEPILFLSRIINGAKLRYWPTEDLDDTPDLIKECDERLGLVKATRATGDEPGKSLIASSRIPKKATIPRLLKAVNKLALVKFDLIKPSRIPRKLLPNY